MSKSVKSLLASVICTVVLAACAEQIPKEALQLSPDSLERRQAQTRVFETDNEAELLSASAALLQDLGFNLDESEVDLGVIVASKERDATEADQVAVSIVLAVLFGVAMPWDDEQKIRAAIITRHLEDRNGFAVRLTMQRIVWDTQGQVSETEPLDDPEMYKEFFGKLSKAVFLEAQEL
jgi:hypothetical protein